VKAGVEEAAIEVLASANTGAAAVGHTATLKAKDLKITSTAAGTATVTVNAGDAPGDEGGDAIVQVKNLSIVGEGGKNSAVGAASLSMTAGTGATAGSRNITVEEDLTLAAGAAEASKFGGSVSLAADDVSVGGTFRASSGAGAGTIGTASFSALDFKAKSIDLTNNTPTNASAFSFSVTNLEVTDRDTEITLTGTDNTNSDVSFANVTLGQGRQLVINNALGELLIANLTVTPDEEGTLSVADSSNLALASLDATDATVTFLLPENYDGSDPFLEVSGTADFTDGTIKINDSQADLPVGADFTLLQAGTLVFSDETIIASDGNIQHIYNLSDDGSNGIRTVFSGIKAEPATKAYSEGVAAQVAFVTAGADLVSETGTANAVLAAQNVAGPAVFSAFSFGSSRYETGSHVDVDSFSLMVGASYGFVTSAVDITLGAFFEYGNGSYDSYNSFPTYDVNGDGDVDYAGGGILSRFEFAKSESGSTYADLAVRFGRSSNEFTSPDLPNNGRYDFDANYFGLNVGFGHIFNITESVSLDLYAKYLWTHQDSEDIKLVSQQDLRFDDVDSQRVRAGLRLSFQPNEFVRPYFGVAYEYEADGKASATIAGVPIDVPELKGSTGIGEIGISVYTGTLVNLDFGVQGYVGQRKGVSGTVALNFQF
jgi:hypothetical protein